MSFHLNELGKAKISSEIQAFTNWSFDFKPEFTDLHISILEDEKEAVFPASTI
jgi:hypothetical protein